MLGLIGKKIGMTQIADAAGQMVPVTVIETGAATVTRTATMEKDGYSAVQVGFGDIRPQKLTKSERVSFEKKNLRFRRYLKEFRPSQNETVPEFQVGQEIGADFFQEGEFVDVQGHSIGKGFQGSIKRWGHSRGPESHGSMYHRRPGSAGASSFPSRTWPGQHMPGRMGGEKKTVQNLLIMKVLKDDNVILVKGSVPGSRNAILTVRKALKKRTKIDLSQVHASKASQTTAPGKKVAKAKKK